jgi:hypothetical protein
VAAALRSHAGKRSLMCLLAVPLDCGIGPQTSGGCTRVCPATCCSARLVLHLLLYVSLSPCVRSAAVCLV